MSFCLSTTSNTPATISGISLDNMQLAFAAIALRELNGGKLYSPGQHYLKIRHPLFDRFPFLVASLVFLCCPLLLTPHPRWEISESLSYVASFPLLPGMDHVPPAFAFNLRAAHPCATLLWENTRRPALAAAPSITSLPALLHRCSASASQPLESQRQHRGNSTSLHIFLFHVFLSSLSLQLCLVGC